MLAALRRIYTEVASRLWSRRFKGGRRASGAALEADIATKLLGSIDRLAEAGAGKPASKVSAVESQPTPSPPAAHAVPRAYVTAAPSATRHAERGELARHFDLDRAADSGLYKDLGDGLRRRAWEHIQAALRFARQGDRRTAKLHVDLANAALVEAAHYMSSEGVTRLSAELRGKLAELAGPAVPPTVSRPPAR